MGSIVLLCVSCIGKSLAAILTLPSPSLLTDAGEGVCQCGDSCRCDQGCCACNKCGEQSADTCGYAAQVLHIWHVFVIYASSSVPTSTVNCTCIPAECRYPACPGNCCSCSCQGCESVYDALVYVLYMHADYNIMKCCCSVNCYT